MENVFSLDLRKIIGDITINTPKCVIHAVTRYSHISYNPEHLVLQKYIDKINIKLNEEIFPMSDDIDNKKIETFISCEHDAWSDENRKIALEHLYSFFLCNELPDKLSKFSFGNKTNAYPLRFNECILYRLCLFYKIETNLNMTIEMMASSLNILMMGTERIRQQIINAINTASPTALITLYNSNLTLNEHDPLIKSSPKVDYLKLLPSHNYTVENCERIVNNLNNLQYLLSKHVPIDRFEAIVITALRFGVNISESLDPIIQFKHIVAQSSDGKTSLRYNPLNDTNFSEKYLKNPIFYDVKKTWCKLLSPIYKDGTLCEFVQNEGYTITSNPGNILASTRNKINIYFGINPYCKKDKTIINLDNVIDIDRDLIVSIGVLNKPETLYHTTFDELNDWFTERNILQDITTFDIFDKEVINKLTMKLNSLLSDNIYIKKSANRLLQTIKNITLMSSVLTEKTVEMTIYARSDEGISLKSFFNDIIEAALYMRGWKIEESEELPLKSKYTNYPLKFQTLIDYNVSIALFKIHENFKKLPKISQYYLKTLNIIKLNKLNNSNTNINLFGHTTNKSLYIDYNATIFDIILKIGEANDQSSCIRTNSTWLLTSAIYYSEICGFSTKIPMTDIDEIV